LKRLPHPPDSAGISPSDFSLFGKAKSVLIGRRFPMKLTFLKQSLRFWIVFQMPNCNVSFEVGLNVLKERLAQQGIIRPGKSSHLPCFVWDRFLYDESNHSLDTL
jgi:hypothetical protein